jgi:hypothetical protein
MSTSSVTGPSAASRVLRACLEIASLSSDFSKRLSSLLLLISSRRSFGPVFLFSFFLMPLIWSENTCFSSAMRSTFFEFYWTFFSERIFLCVLIPIEVISCVLRSERISITKMYLWDLHSVGSLRASQPKKDQSARNSLKRAFECPFEETSKAWGPTSFV